MTIWKQGQFYPELGKKVVDLPNKVDPGPSDPMIKIDGFHVLPDREGNFIEGGEINYPEDELDAIHTYAIIRMVINMYEELLGKPIHWSWWKDGMGEPLTVKIRNNDVNARFIKEYRCIELDFYGPYNNWIYICRSVDLIAHETGHAILDSLLSHLNEGSIESRGIGEAFCDLTAMFWILSQRDMCQHVIEETDRNLRQNSILSLFGVGYGYRDNQYNELRNTIDEVQYTGKHKFSYDIGQILVKIFYEILNDLYLSKQIDMKNEVENLFQSGKTWMKNIFQLFLKLDQSHSNVQDFVHLIIQQFSNEKIEIKKHFKRHGVL